MNTENTPQQEATHLPTAPKTKSPMVMFGLGLLGVLVVGTIAGYVMVWRQVKQVSMSPWVVKAAGVFRMPAATVNGRAIRYADYVSDVQTLKKFYGTSPDVTDQQISDQVMSRLIANELVSEAAKEFHVSVANSDVDDVQKNMLKQFPTTDAAENELKEKYGWTLADYRNRVIEPLVREQKVAAAFASSTDESLKQFSADEVRASHILFKVDDPSKDASVKKSAQAVLDQAIRGADFAELAKKYGSDGTKEAGGDLGWFGRGQMVPEFEDAVFVGEVGKVIPTLVKTSFGYHIVKVDGKQTMASFPKYMDAKLRAAVINIVIDVHNPFAELLQKAPVDAASR